MDQRRAILAEAQDAYDRGIADRRRDPAAAAAAFTDAAGRFRLLVDDGVANGRLDYNHGNALMQLNRIGEAILSYRNAARLIPGDARLEANLAYARSLRRSQIAPSGGRALSEALIGWHRRVPQRLRLAVFVAAYVVAWGAMSAGVLRRGRIAPRIAVVFTVVWVLAASSLVVDLWLSRTVDGVLLVDEVILRKGPGEGFEPQFAQPLHQGVEFELVESRPGWRLIRLPDGGSGWVREDQSGLVRSR
jgi:hypothetical protein